MAETFNSTHGLVYKIRVIPRKKGNSSCSGFLYILDGLWCLQKVDLSFEKGMLKFFDEMNLLQEYELADDSLWLISHQEYTYKTKQGRFKFYDGKTTIIYKGRELDFKFPKGFFGPEVALTHQEAYEHDAGYWNRIRPTQLDTQEMELIRITDSVEAVHISQAYKDSMEALYNKVTIAEVLYDGVGFRKGEERFFYTSSLLSIIDYQVVGGWRLGPYISDSKRFKNGKIIGYDSNVSLGLKIRIGMGRLFLYRYDPMRFADLRVYFGKFFSTINSYDAYLNLLSTNNYIQTLNYNLNHRMELFNGFFYELNLSVDNRQSIEGLNSETI